MKYRAFILLPSPQGAEGMLFNVSSLELTMSDNEKCLFEVINFNCPSLLSMEETVLKYFAEVMKREPTERNIATATYLLIMILLLGECPNGAPISEDVLKFVLHKDEEYKYVRSDSGYYFLFETAKFSWVESAVSSAFGK